MPRIQVTTRTGDVRSLELAVNQTLMEGIRDSGIGELLALCGGCLSCATCHVYVDPAFADRLPPLGPDEDGLLEGAIERRENSRLSCQIRLNDSHDGLAVTIAPDE